MDVQALLNEIETGLEGVEDPHHSVRLSPTNMRAILSYVRELDAVAVDAIDRLSEQDCARGLDEGKSATSEMAGVVDGWKERAKYAEHILEQRDKQIDTLEDMWIKALARAEKAEAECKRLRDALRFAKDGCEAGCNQYASRTLHGQEVPGDEQFPWVKAMQIGRDKASAALENSHE